jgi:hypothetical protein
MGGKLKMLEIPGDEWERRSSYKLKKRLKERGWQYIQSPKIVYILGSCRAFF